MVFCFVRVYLKSYHACAQDRYFDFANLSKYTIGGRGIYDSQNDTIIPGENGRALNTQTLQSTTLVQNWNVTNHRGNVENSLRDRHPHQRSAREPGTERTTALVGRFPKSRQLVVVGGSGVEYLVTPVSE